MSDSEQIREKIIEKGFTYGLDLRLSLQSISSAKILDFIDKNFQYNNIFKSENDFFSKYFGTSDTERIMILKEGVKEGLDVEKYSNKLFSKYQMLRVKEGLIKNLDVSHYLDPSLTEYQISEIVEGLKAGLDVSWYADKNFNVGQMEEIKRGLKRGLDVSVFAKTSIHFNDMNKIRCLMNNGRDVYRYI